MHHIETCVIFLCFFFKVFFTFSRGMYLKKECNAVFRLSTS